MTAADILRALASGAGIAITVTLCALLKKHLKEYTKKK